MMSQRYIPPQLDMSPEAVARRHRIWIEGDKRPGFARGDDRVVPGSHKRAGVPSRTERGGFPRQKCWNI